MIEIQNLDNISLEEILEEAKKQIVYYSTEWTNFQESDPGITLVELFAWLKSVQHEYLNRKSPEVEKKFLKLLDININKNQGSETLLEVTDLDQDINLPLRTKWKFNNMIFENIYTQILVKSKILSVEFENPEFNTHEEYYKFDGKKSFFVFGKEINNINNNNIRRFTINFDSKLPSEYVINLYFSVHTSKGAERNIITDLDNFERMAEVKWEYYGIQDNKLGWHELEIIQDSTYNFLFSGIVKIKIPGEILELDGEYKIRASLEYNEYDYPPKINNILTNIFLVKQNDTKCKNIIITKDEISPEHIIDIYSNLGLYGYTEIYYKKHNGWKLAKNINITHDKNIGKTSIDLSNIWDELKIYKHDTEVVMIVSCEKSWKDKIILGSGTNISYQTVKIDAENILDNSLEIMISENINGEEIFYKWEKVDNFFSSSKYDKHYILDKKNNLILFGDHERGMAPRIGLNNIKICNLSQTFGRESNIKSHMINSVITENKLLKNCKIIQVQDSRGGCDDETLEQAQARAAHIFNDPMRAVTVQDYENIVRKTPGLIFINVRVLPNYMPGEDLQKQNCVTIAVRWNRKIGLKLPESFRKNIINHLEKYRLINTKINIIGPEYIGLIITGVITVESSYREQDGFIENEIKDYIKNLNNNMGEVLKFGDLFGMIDRLKYVSNLNKLRIISLGDNTQKNASEDIIIPPNGIYYIEKIDFSYIKSSEIYKN
ncbi:MAG: baseplate J/gp47 family protein [Clostridia bacterium]|nr:baseplate J/gp47 family protein [Clostridia bacterium]